MGELLLSPTDNIRYHPRLGGGEEGGGGEQKVFFKPTSLGRIDLGVCYTRGTRATPRCGWRGSMGRWGGQVSMKVASWMAKNLMA